MSPHYSMVETCMWHTLVLSFSLSLPHTHSRKYKITFTYLLCDCSLHWDQTSLIPWIQPCGQHRHTFWNSGPSCVRRPWRTQHTPSTSSVTTQPAAAAPSAPCRSIADTATRFWGNAVSSCTSRVWLCWESVSLDLSTAADVFHAAGKSHSLLFNAGRGHFTFQSCHQVSLHHSSPCQVKSINPTVSKQVDVHWVSTLDNDWHNHLCSHKRFM